MEGRDTMFTKHTTMSLSEITCLFNFMLDQYILFVYLYFIDYILFISFFIHILLLFIFQFIHQN